MAGLSQFAALSIFAMLFALLAGTISFWLSPFIHMWSRRFEYEADAFARLLKRLNYTDCSVRSNLTRKYADGREEKDVMWAAVCRVQTQFGEAGFAPR